MKLIIDIPEEHYRRGAVMAEAIRNGIPKSEQVTNYWNRCKCFEWKENEVSE